MSEKIGLVSLGCSKNLVDSEQMLYLLDEAGYAFTSDLDEADAVIVNTCGFIDDAKAEAIENILELCTIRDEEGSRLRAVVVTGCLPERHKDELYRELPEIDGVLGCSALGDIVPVLQAALNGEKPLVFGDRDAALTERGRIPATPPYTAYVKIAEGCDNRCAYCVIPSIRGTLRSRRMEDILDECRALAEAGARELIIIAQDSTKYGLDLYGEARLPALLDALCAIDTVEWIRLHYLNPDGVTPRLLATIAAQPKIVRYLDIPIQHVNSEILRAMHRHYTGDDVRRLLADVRAALPGVVLRTSVMVGFPGETDAVFDELCAFLREQKIERAGVFAFSPQEGTAAAALPDQVDEDVRIARAAAVQEIQADVMEAYHHSLVGSVLPVLCEGYDRIAEICYGRSFADSPEVDGKVFFTARKSDLQNGQLEAGVFYPVLLEDVQDGDLIGRVVQDAPEMNKGDTSI